MRNFIASSVCFITLTSSLGLANQGTTKRKPAHAPARANAYVCGKVQANGDFLIEYRKYLGQNPDVPDREAPGIFGTKQASLNLYEGNMKLTEGSSYCFSGNFSYGQAGDQPSLDSFSSMMNLNQ